MFPKRELVDLPQDIGMGADQPGPDPFVREDFGSFEVEFVGQTGVEGMPGQLVDGVGGERLRVPGGRERRAPPRSDGMRDEERGRHSGAG